MCYKLSFCPSKEMDYLWPQQAFSQTLEFLCWRIWGQWEPGRPRGTYGIVPCSTSLLLRECPVPPLLPLACGSLENGYSTRYPCGITKICYDCSYPKTIHYRGQDPHIHALSTDVLPLTTVFLRHWNFVNSEQFWHTRWNLWEERSWKSLTCMYLFASMSSDKAEDIRAGGDSRGGRWRAGSVGTVQPWHGRDTFAQRSLQTQFFPVIFDWWGTETLL